jgi:hypothetical protein
VGQGGAVKELVSHALVRRLVYPSIIKPQSILVTQRCRATP